MKKTILYTLIFTLAAFIWTGCEPMEEEKPSIGNAPAETDLSFTIIPGDDDFNFTFSNTSSAVGLAKWNLGNGTVTDGDEVSGYFPIADTYTVTMTLYTAGGSTSITKELVQEKTDYSIFSDPVYINISGGADAANGKTWVVDSMTVGHFGVGPADGVGTEWWAAAPLAKSGGGAYDDELNFNINDFLLTYDNKGESFVKEYQKDNPNFSNARLTVDDWTVDYTTPVEGTWSITTKNNVNYVVFAGGKPIFPGFDVGAVNNEYKIIKVTENQLELSCVGGDGNAWHYLLIPKGYERPTLEFDLSATETGNDNEYEFSLANVSIPESISVENIRWDFGDGTSSETTDETEKFTVTYLRKGAYNVSVTITTNDDTYSASQTISVEANHPTYSEYLLDAMVMYTDFGETMLMNMSFDQAGGAGSIEVVSNPDKSMYPNRSSNVAKYVKTNTEWANAYMELPAGYRFDLRQQSVFKILVYGKAGDKVLLKLENTDRGGNAWQTGTYDLIYTIQEDNTWEIAEYDFAGVAAGFDWTGDIFTSDITTDDNFSHDFYNVVRIMLNPGDASNEFSFYFDDLAGPHIEGLK